MLKIVFGILGVGLLLGGAYYFLRGPAPNSASNGLASETADSTSSPQATTTQPITQTTKPMHAILHTSMGDITIEFYADQAPNTVANFVKLAQSGFYNGVKFHRVIKGFMDQAGDPLTKDDSKMAQWGTGGPGYTIQDEFGTAHPNVAGTIAMANTGRPNSGGSQFFLNAVDNHFLDGNYAVFGHVTAGMNIVTAINQVQTVSDRPVTPITITTVTIVE